MLTLAEMEEAGGEDGWTEEAKEDGATDEAKAHILLLGTKPLSDGTEGVSQLTSRTQGEGEDRQGWISGVHEVSTHGMQSCTLKHEVHIHTC